MRPQPMICLADVEAGSRWFQAVLGLTSGHGGSDYEMLMDGDDMVAQLHVWEAHEHPHLGDATDHSRGNGVALWFTTDDFWYYNFEPLDGTDGVITADAGCTFVAGRAVMHLGYGIHFAIDADNLSGTHGTDLGHLQNLSIWSMEVYL